MQLAHRAALGGVQLDEIDPRIIIKGIEPGSGKDTVTTVTAGSGDGTRITGMRRESTEVAVRFSMNIRRNTLSERADVLERIIAWAARGGWLTVNYKPNRRMYADEIVTPGEGDLWKRTSEYTITFRAHAIPYWQEESAVSAGTGTGSSGSGEIQVNGSAVTKAEAELRNMSGATINNASITIGGKTMNFEGLGLGGNETLTIDHIIADKVEVVRCRIGGRSVMACRSGADDFTVNPGTNGFSFSAQRACRLTVSCRGRFR